MKSKIFAKISELFGERESYQPSKNKTENVNNTPNTEEFEHCVICGELTCVPISMPIDCRENYEIGIGQLCAKCKRKL